MLISAIVTALLAQAAPAGADRVEVAYDDIATDRNASAIARIETMDDGHEDSAARLINLGIAYARNGQPDRARELLTRAVHAERFDLETGEGRWVDSRKLALRALAALDRGELHATRTASR